MDAFFFQALSALLPSAVVGLVVVDLRFDICRWACPAEPGLSGLGSFLGYVFIPFVIWFFGCCVLFKVSRVAGSLHRVIVPMHASMSGFRLRTLSLPGTARILGPVARWALPGGWFSSLYMISVCKFGFLRSPSLGSGPCTRCWITVIHDGWFLSMR